MSVPSECPKCGRFAKGAFGEDSWAHGPTYQSGQRGYGHGGSFWITGEWLKYECKQCGYTFFEPTRDSRKPETGAQP